jgi:hypothetical protein
MCKRCLLVRGQRQRMRSSIFTLEMSLLGLCTAPWHTSSSCPSAYLIVILFSFVMGFTHSCTTCPTVQLSTSSESFGTFSCRRRRCTQTSSGIVGGTCECGGRCAGGRGVGELTSDWAACYIDGCFAHVLCTACLLVCMLCPEDVGIPSRRGRACCAVENVSASNCTPSRSNLSTASSLDYIVCIVSVDGAEGGVSRTNLLHVRVGSWNLWRFCGQETPCHYVMCR